MPNIDIYKQGTREPAAGNSHKFIISLEGSFDLLFERASMSMQNRFRIESVILDGSRLIVQSMIREIGCKESLGAALHIHRQYIEFAYFGIYARTYRCHPTMPPIERGENQFITNLISFFWKIGLAASLTAPLHGETLRPNTLIDKHPNQLTRC